MVNPRNLVGKQIKQFRIDQFIAKGAMGMVFKAFDTVLTRTVAIKLIFRETEDSNLGPQEMAMREEARKRLIQEAKAAGQLTHPNIVTVYSYGETGDFEFICMEYVPGKTLAQALTEKRAFDTLEAITIFQQILQALDAAYSQQIVHRDIKPSNIMMTPDNRVKVMDFGVAKLPTLSMTVTGTVLGTPYYMSPEQIVGQKVDIRSDIFSVGTVFYEALTGERPFEAQDTAALTYQIINVEPVPPVVHNTKIPAPVSNIVTKAMAKDRTQRYQTPAEMLQDLTMAKEIVRGAQRAQEDQNVLARIMDSGQLRPASSPDTEELQVGLDRPEQGIPGPQKKRPSEAKKGPFFIGPNGLKIAAVTIVFFLVAGVAFAVLYRQWNRPQPSLSSPTGQHQTETASPAPDSQFQQGSVTPVTTPETQVTATPSDSPPESVTPKDTTRSPNKISSPAPATPYPEKIKPSEKAQPLKPSPQKPKAKVDKPVEKKPTKKTVKSPQKEPTPPLKTEIDQDPSSTQEQVKAAPSDSPTSTTSQHQAETEAPSSESQLPHSDVPPPVPPEETQVTASPSASPSEQVTPPDATQSPSPEPSPAPAPPASEVRPQKPTSFSGAKAAYANREITAEEYRTAVTELKTAYIKEVEQLKTDYRAGTIDKAEYYRRAVEIKTRYR
jgi:serine/threonine protein kinase